MLSSMLSKLEGHPNVTSILIIPNYDIFINI